MEKYGVTKATMIEYSKNLSEKEKEEIYKQHNIKIVKDTKKIKCLKRRNLQTA